MGSSDPGRPVNGETRRDHDKYTVDGEARNGSLDKPSAETRDGLEPSKQHRAFKDPPPLVAAMSPDQRVKKERALVRKIDIRLLPAIVLMYVMNYLDRNNIASARLGGLEADLGIDPTSSAYNTAVAILFVGYLLMQVPSNLMLYKIGNPAIYLPTAMLIWGVISAATAGVHSAGGLYAVRFFLGFIEAAYFPGCLFFLSSWYTRKELGFRTAILYSGSLLSGAFSGLIAAGIVNGLDGARGLRAWRWLFIIEGVITVIFAICAVFVLPNFPRTTKWLTEEERQLAIWRLDEDVGEDDWVSSEDQTFLHGFLLACKDIKMWILMIILLGIVSAGSVTNFFPTVVQQLGYSSVQTLLLTVPPYALAVITTFLNSWHADRTGERFLHVVLPLCFGLLSFILSVATDSLGARYFAILIMVPGVYTGYVVVLAWISNTIPRPPAKRAASLAFINAVSNASSIYAAYMYPGWQKPRFPIAFGVNIGTVAMAIVGATVLRFILIRLNHKLERGEFVEGAINNAPGGDVEGATHEEGAKRGFRFLY